MVSLAALINRPITIEGKEVILVQDIAVETPEEQGEGYSLITEATPTCPSIYVLEQNLRDVRAHYFGYPVYGLWHVLHHSGILKPNVELQIIPTGEREGIFVRFAPETGKLLLTGRYADGIFQDAGDLLLEQAVLIDFEMSKSRLPVQQARLLEEWVVIQDRAKQVKRMAFGAIVVGMLVLGLLVDGTLKMHYESNMDHYAEKKQQQTLLEQKVTALERIKVFSFPNYSPLLAELEELYAVSPRTLMPPQNLASAKLVAVAPRELTFDLHAALSFVQTLQLPNSDWKISWTNPRVQYETPRY